MTDHQTFRSLNYWIEEVRKESPNVEILIVGNKIDSYDYQVGQEEVQEFSERMALSHVFTSAATGMGVKDAFSILVKRI